MNFVVKFKPVLAGFREWVNTVSDYPFVEVETTSAGTGRVATSPLNLWEIMLNKLIATEIKGRFDFVAMNVSKTFTGPSIEITFRPSDYALPQTKKRSRGVWIHPASQAFHPQPKEDKGGSPVVVNKMRIRVPHS